MLPVLHRYDHNCPNLTVQRPEVSWQASLKTTAIVIVRVTRWAAEVRRQIPKGAMTMGHTGSSEGSGGRGGDVAAPRDL